MDPLTHTFLGGVLADTGLRRATPLATATLLLGANLPDVDVASYVHGPDYALGFRRGWTHGVLALAVLPLVLTLALLAFDRWRRRRGHDGEPVRGGRLLALAAFAVATHPVLDWFNTYGVRFLMPFDGTWFYGDTLFIVDPWIWLLFGGVLFLNHSASSRALWRWGALAALATVLVMTGSGPYWGARILWIAAIVLLVILRMKRPDSGGRRRARWALGLAGLYVAAMMGSTALAADHSRSQLTAAGVSPIEDLMAGPWLVDPLARVVVAETPAGYRFGVHHWLRRPRFRLDDQVIPAPPPSPVLDAALAAPCVQGMLAWVRYPFFEVEEAGDGYVVYLLDGRYVRRRTRGFGAAAVRLSRDLSESCVLP